MKTLNALIYLLAFFMIISTVFSLGINFLLPNYFEIAIGSTLLLSSLSVLILFFIEGYKK